MNKLPTFDEAAASLRTRAGLVAESLRRGYDNTLWIDELGWTLGELAAHILSVPRIYKRVLLEPDSFEPPEHMADFGQLELEAVGSFDLDELADSLIEAVDELLSTLDGLRASSGDGAHTVDFYTTQMHRAGVVGIALNELSMHHRDIAVAVGEAFTMSDRDVVITMSGMMPASEVFCDQRIALRCPGLFHIGFRTGDHWTIEVKGGLVSVSPGRPERADVRIVGAPLPMVLTSFGRMHPVKAFLTGGVLVWGRKPWKLWWFQQLFVEELSLNGR